MALLHTLCRQNPHFCPVVLEIKACVVAYPDGVKSSLNSFGRIKGTLAPGPL